MNCNCKENLEHVELKKTLEEWRDEARTLVGHLLEFERVYKILQQENLKLRNGLCCQKCGALPVVAHFGDCPINTKGAGFEKNSFTATGLDKV